MPTVGGPPTGEHGPGRTKRVLFEHPSRVDRVFDRMTLASGLTVLIILTVVGVFLLYQGRHAWSQMGWSFFTTKVWESGSTNPTYGVLGLLFGTIVVGIIAVAIAIPLGISVGLFIAEFAPLATRKLLQGTVDLLAAVPSILFGLWGFSVPLRPRSCRCRAG